MTAIIILLQYDSSMMTGTLCQPQLKPIVGMKVCALSAGGRGGLNTLAVAAAGGGKRGFVILAYEKARKSKSWTLAKITKLVLSFSKTRAPHKTHKRLVFEKLRSSDLVYIIDMGSVWGSVRY